MNTVEIAIEQLLAGTLALLVFLLPIVGLPPAAALTNTAVVVGFLGVAYMLGVVMDKTSDRILGGLDRFHVHVDAHWATADKPRRGPFQPDIAEVRLRLKGSDAVDKWMTYLRTRIRVARIVAVFVPLLAPSLAVWAKHRQYCGGAATTPWDWVADPARCPSHTGWTAFFPLIAYVVVFAVTWLPWLELPRDDEVTYDEAERPENGTLKLSRWRAVGSKALLPIVLLHAFCSAGAAVFLNSVRLDAIVMIVVLPSLVGLAAAWSWWAVLRTYRSFLRKATSPEMTKSAPAP